MSARFSCNSFAEIDWSNYQQNFVNALRQEIHDVSKEYLLSVDENNYKSYLIEKYSLEALEVFRDSERIVPEQKGSHTEMISVGLDIVKFIFSKCSITSVAPLDYSKLNRIHGR
jgi:hypothetical protein